MSEIKTNKSDSTVVNVSTKVTNVQMITIAGNPRYRFSITDDIEAIVKTSEDTYEPGTASYFDLAIQYALATIFNENDELATIYSALKERSIKDGKTNPFGAVHLALVLKGAKIEIERSFHASGEVYSLSDGTEAVYENDGWQTRITKIVLSDSGQKKVDQMIDKLLF